MIWQGKYAVAPNLIDHIRSHFVLAGLLEVSGGFGLAHAPSKRHLISLVELPAHLCTPC